MKTVSSREFFEAFNAVLHKVAPSQQWIPQVQSMSHSWFAILFSPPVSTLHKVWDSNSFEYFPFRVRAKLKCVTGRYTSLFFFFFGTEIYSFQEGFGRNLFISGNWPILLPSFFSDLSLKFLENDPELNRGFVSL